MLLNATTPFFLADDPPDIEPPPVHPTKPPIRGESTFLINLLIGAYQLYMNLYKTMKLLMLLSFLYIDIVYQSSFWFALGTPLPIRSKRTAAGTSSKKQQQRRARQTSASTGPGPNGMDKRIDPEALAMAEVLEDACDVFLREASRSYLRILEEFGIRP